jgi:predicted RND superfamily exporter protein
MRKVIDVTTWTSASQGRTFLCLADDDAVDSLAAHFPDWQAWARARGVTLRWHGVAPQIHRSAQSIKHIAAESLPSMMILIAGLVAALFRRLRTALVAAWVCLLPVSALTIVAIAAGMRLGPVTLMIGSVTAGLAVDDTLHLLSSSRRHRSLRRATIECWKPCIGSSLAAASCFSLFTLSPFGPTQQFGLLMALATVFAMLGNQLVLPASLPPRPLSSPARDSPPEDRPAMKLSAPLLTSPSGTASRAN